MRPVVPPVTPAGAQRITFAARQMEYEVLPATVDRDGVVMTEWMFTAQDLAVILEGGRLRMWTVTGGEPFHPVQFEVVPASAEV